MLNGHVDIDVLAQPSFHTSLLTIAQQAGVAILDVYNSSDFCVEMKTDNSPVTKADLIANAIIEKGLAELTPDIPVISEENLKELGNVDCTCSYWLVDPLDGTKEFIKKNGQFTVNIALIIKGYPAFGVVYVPVKDVSYWGGDGIGAWRKTGDDVTAIKVASRNIPPRIVASSNYMNEETNAFLSQFGEYTLMQSGSSMKICMIAEGSADFYPRFAPTNEWDTAAADAVLRGAGGVLAQFDGTPLQYCKDKTLNPNFIGANRKDPILSSNCASS